MEQLLISPYWLAAIFFLVALLYASVGLGGGSSYTAILSIVGATYLSIPTVSLSLNVAVTSIGSLNFMRAGHARWSLIVPFLISSMPLAYVGGSLALPQQAFTILLLVSLLFVLLRIYLPAATQVITILSQRKRIAISLVAGSVLGFIAGAVGIGGGIYLVPLILLLGLGTAQQAAVAGAIFVWVNSVIGLIARIQSDRVDLSFMLPLLIAVLFGGWLGSRLGAKMLPAIIIERILGVVILIAVILLVRKLL